MKRESILEKKLEYLRKNKDKLEKKEKALAKKKAADEEKRALKEHNDKINYATNAFKLNETFKLFEATNNKLPSLNTAWLVNSDNSVCHCVAVSKYRFDEDTEYLVLSKLYTTRLMTSAEKYYISRLCCEEDYELGDDSDIDIDINSDYPIELYDRIDREYDYFRIVIDLNSINEAVTRAVVG